MRSDQFSGSTPAELKGEQRIRGTYPQRTVAVACKALLSRLSFVARCNHLLAMSKSEAGVVLFQSSIYKIVGTE